MTYQEILVEWDSIRMADMAAEDQIVRILKRVDNLEWAMQAILEKLRDAEPIT